MNRNSQTKKGDSVVEAEKLCFSYDTGYAVCNVNFKLNAGESMAIIGPNGSGKSTLLGLISGLLEPSAGNINVTSPRPAIVLQADEVNYDIPLSVRDTVQMGRYATTSNLKPLSRADSDLTLESMKQLEIEDLANSQLRELSGGQKQRTAVAQALNQQSPVLLLDEPVNGLDIVSRQLILDAIDSAMANGTAVALTTHNLDDADLCTKVLLLNKEVVAFGTPDEVLTEENLKTAFGRSFAKVGDQLIVDDGHHH